jgi:hypothetical protein
MPNERQNESATLERPKQEFEFALNAEYVTPLSRPEWRLFIIDDPKQDWPFASGDEHHG